MLILTWKQAYFCSGIQSRVQLINSGWKLKAPERFHLVKESFKVKQCLFGIFFISKKKYDNPSSFRFWEMHVFLAEIS